MNLLPGSHRFTSTTGVSSAVGVSGQPFRAFCVHTATLTAGKLVLRNGTSVSGTTYIQVDGSTQTGTTVNFERGVLFPNGCFLTADIGLQSILIVGSTEPA